MVTEEELKKFVVGFKCKDCGQSGGCDDVTAHEIALIKAFSMKKETTPTGQIIPPRDRIDILNNRLIQIGLHLEVLAHDMRTIKAKLRELMMKMVQE